MKLIRIVIAAVVLSGLCGCGEKQSVLKEEKTNISFSFWEPGMAHELENALQSVVDGYEELHPEVHIELISRTVEEYQNWIKTCVASDTLPDIQTNYDNTLKEQYAAGLIADLTDTLGLPSAYGQGEPWRETFLKSKQSSFGVAENKEVYSMPFFGTELAVFYNKSIYEKLGLAVPETWEEFVNNCEAIQKSGILPVAFMAQKKDANDWLKWEIAGGLFAKKHIENEKLNIDGDMMISKREIYNMVCSGALDISRDAEYQNEYKEYIRRLTEFLKYCGEDPGYEESVAKSMFLTGEAAHIHTGVWDIQGLSKSEGKDFEVGTFKFPVFTERETLYSGVRINNDSVHSLSVTKSAEKSPEKLAAAIDFLQYFTSKEVNQQFINDTMLIPVINGVEACEEIKVFQNEGYGHDETLLAGDSGNLIYNILSGNLPELDDEFFVNKQKAIKEAAEKYMAEEDKTER